MGDGFILQLADPDITEWSIAAVRRAAEAAGRDPEVVTICVAAPAYVTDGSDEGLAHGRDQCRWFGGMVGNHVADIVARYGGDGAAVPEALTSYIAGREGYDYNEHGRAGNTHTDFVPDEIVDRFCLIGAARGTGGPPERAGRPRRGPVRPLPPARRQGRHATQLRRARDPGRQPARGREGLTAQRCEPSALTRCTVIDSDSIQVIGMPGWSPLEGTLPDPENVKVTGFPLSRSSAGTLADSGCASP